jgi:hypothetical protein
MLKEFPVPQSCFHSVALGIFQTAKLIDGLPSEYSKKSGWMNVRKIPVETWKRV